jgi:hypothetical protein
MSSLHRSPLLLSALTTLFALACSDTTSPREGAGIYRLERALGQALPASLPPISGGGRIDHGVLFLRADGTYGLESGTGVFPGNFESGTWRLNDKNLTLIRDPRALTVDTLRGLLSGDTVVLERPAFVFRLKPRPATTLSSGVFLLTSLAGAAGSPLTLVDTTAGRRSVFRVDFDSIRIIDDVFFLRHRRERFYEDLPGTDSATWGLHEWSTGGSHESLGSSVVLRGVLRFDGLRTLSDTLQVVDGALVRRSVFSAFPEERYERRP